MSLELEMQRLTAAIEKLTVLLATPAQQQPPTNEQPPPPVVESTPDIEQPKAATVTHDDVQGAILAKVRLNMDNKPKIKAILSEFKAAKVSDIDAAQLADVLARVNAL